MNFLKNKKLIPCLCIFLSVLICILAVALVSAREKEKTEQNIKFLKSYLSQNENGNFFAASQAGRYYAYTLSGKTASNELPDLIGDKYIEYMTEDTIYLTRREDSVITVYRTDYSFRDTEEVYSYENPDTVITRYFLDKDTLYYSSGGKYYIYRFSDGSLTETERGGYKNYQKYSYSVGSGASKNEIVLENRETGKTVTLNAKEIIGDITRKDALAKYLYDSGKFSFFDVKAKKDKIYFIFASDGIYTAYSYEFDTDEFEFFSAIASDVISGGGGERFYFE